MYMVQNLYTMVCATLSPHVADSEIGVALERVSHACYMHKPGMALTSFLKKNQQLQIENCSSGLNSGAGDLQYNFNELQLTDIVGRINSLYANHSIQ